jgi:spectinomycin phosphotransferase
MRQRPAVSEAALAAHIEHSYGLRSASLAFLPIGADPDSAIYRLTDLDGRAYFLKLRSGVFDGLPVEIPDLLRRHGITAAIPPIAGRDGSLWTRFEPFALSLYPFVDGVDGGVTPLADRQWRALGAALRKIHTVRQDEPLVRRISRDTFSPEWREAVREVLQQADLDGFGELDAAEAAALLRGERKRIAEMLTRAEALATVMRADPPPAVLCHGDLHARNVLLGADDGLWIVDWDTVVLAPLERDFEQIGGAWGGPREAHLVAEAYGRDHLDQTALAYYRYRRIVEDIAVAGRQLLTTHDGGENRAQELHFLRETLRPGGALDTAIRLDAGFNE